MCVCVCVCVRVSACACACACVYVVRVARVHGVVCGACGVVSGVVCGACGAVRVWCSACVVCRVVWHGVGWRGV